MGNVIPFSDRKPVDADWRTELLERAPQIVARSINSESAVKRFAGDWWRSQFIAEFGYEPIS